MGHFDNKDRGEWLPCKLGNWGDRADEGVLVAFEAGVFLKTEDGAISEDGFVEDLQKQGSVQTKEIVVLGIH